MIKLKLQAFKNRQLFEKIYKFCNLFAFSAVLLCRGQNLELFLIAALGNNTLKGTAIKMEKKIGKGSALAAKLLFLPAAAGFMGLFMLNFVLIALTLAFAAVGLLCLPVGVLYIFGLLNIISDLSPGALTAAGLFCLCFGCFLGFSVARFAPFCIFLGGKYWAALKGEKRDRLPVWKRKNGGLVLSLVLSLAALGAAVLAQKSALDAGFESTVVRERLVFEDAKYINVSTANLDFELRHHGGEGILVEYVNDTPMLIEQTDENYLKLVQDDSFRLSLFAREQFGYNMVIYLPENDYRDFYLDSGSGSITLRETLSEYAELHTRSGNIIITEATEKLSASTVEGNIYCSYNAFVNAGTFNSKSGDIYLRVPDYSGIKLCFRTDSGYLDSRLLGFKERFYGSVDAEKKAELWRYLYVTTGTGGLELEAKGS